MREGYAWNAQDHGLGPSVAVRLVCSGCGRTVGEIWGDGDGGPVELSGADSRGGVRYLRPLAEDRGRAEAADERVRFYCDDRCGIRYAIPRDDLAALVGLATGPGVYRVHLPVRGRHDGRAPTLARRAAARRRT
jgi:hypothetical protein